MAQTYGYAAMLLAGIITFGGSLLVGGWCDRYGRLPLIRWARIAILLLALPVFWLLTVAPHPAVLLSVVTLMVGLTTLGSVPTLLVISELFPQRVRAWGLRWFIALASQFSAALPNTSLHSRSRSAVRCWRPPAI